MFAHRVPMIALAILCAAGGCGGGRRHLDAARPDAPPLDGGVLDATADASAINCSLGALASGATRSVHVTYDIPIDFMRPAGPAWGGDASAMFVDANGVAVFGHWEFVRFQVDGTQVGVVPYPPRASDGYRWEVLSVAQGAGGYGALVLANTAPPWDLKFCPLGLDGLIVPASCTHVSSQLGLASVAWDGSQYVVLYSTWAAGSATRPAGTTTLHTTRFAIDGTSIAASDLWSAAGSNLGPLAPGVSLGGALYWCLKAPRSDGCPTALLARMDMAGSEANLDLLPSTHGLDTACVVAASSTSAAAAYGARCYAPGSCSAPPGVASQGLAVSVAGQDVTLRERSVIDGTAPMGQLLAWDGEKFIFAQATAVSRYLHVIRDDGTYDSVTGVLPLANVSDTKESRGRTSLVAVAPNDYLILYGYQDSPDVDVMHLARVTLLP